MRHLPIPISRTKMKKWRIKFNSSYTKTPLSFWVHKNLDNDVWDNSKIFDPELPKSIPCKGYPFLIVSVFGVELEFASVAEFEHFLTVIKSKNMPTTSQLSKVSVQRHHLLFIWF